MSIQSEIDRIKQNIENAYVECADKEATLPSAQNSENLAETIRSIPAGTVEGGYWAEIIDYDGTILYRKKGVKEGDRIPFPNPPEHEGLIFDGWSASEKIEGGEIVAPENNIMAGALYHTASGATEIDVYFPEALSSTTITFATLSNLTQIDWGDGTIDTELSHTYENYGQKYTIKIYGITEIPSYMASAGSSTYNYSVIAIRLSQNITLINDYGFSYLHELRSITFSASTIKLNKSILSRCAILDSVVLPSATNISGNFIFGYCYNLKKVVIPSKVTTLTGGFLQDCYAIEHIAIPSSIITMSGTAHFSGCYSLKEVILRGPTTLPNYTFRYCYSLSKVELSSNLQTIGQESFVDCGSLTDELRISASILGVNLTSKQITGLKSLNKLILDSPNSCYIEYPFMADMLNLREIILPERICYIYSSSLAFTNVEKIVFSQILQSYMNPDLGKGTTNLRILDFSRATSIPNATNDAISRFSWLKSYTKIIVPDSLYDTWIATTNWEKFKPWIYKASECDEAYRKEVQ